MIASERLLNGQINIKPAYLIETKEELISERDRMEANWDESMRPRMQTLSRASFQKFGTPISQL